MFTRNAWAVAVMALAIAPGCAISEGPNLGRQVSAADIAAWDTSIMPDGTGLPPGSGTAAAGARIFAQKCAACHGENGKGGLNSAMVGPAAITSINGAERSIANFWPYATTVFDYIRRAMPWQQPKTLTNDEVYALTAYLFTLNKLIGDNDVMNAETLPRIRMPNRDGFIVRFPDKI